MCSVLNNVHGLRIIENVIFDSMGHIIFLETGAEIANVISNNLVALTRESIAMLNTELTPASFHFSNLNNINSGNAACGSHGYGFWYSPTNDGFMDVYSVTVCPHTTIVRSFQDNVAHSNAMGGMAIFSMHGLPIIPLYFHCTLKDSPFAMNHFNGLIAYNNLGFGVMINGDIGNMKLERFKLVNNTRTALILPARLRGRWDKQGLYDSVISGGDGVMFGIRLANYHRWTVSGTTFEDFRDCGYLGTVYACSGAVINFPVPCSLKKSGGWTTRFAKTTWLRAPLRMGWKWEHQAVLQDQDGSFAETSGPAAVVPANSLLIDPRAFPSCNVDLRYGVPRDYGCAGVYVSGLVCEGLEFRRFGIGVPESGNSEPNSLAKGSPIVISHGMTSGDQPYGRFINALDDDWMLNTVRASPHPAPRPLPTPRARPSTPIRPGL